MTVRVEHGDCLEVIPRLVEEGVVVDAIVTDPPYGLEFMGQEWDAPWQSRAGFTKPGIGPRETPWPAFTAAHAEFGNANPTCAACGGRARGSRKCQCASPDWRVRGKQLDPNYKRAVQMRAFQAWSEEWARAAYDVLKPGGYLLVFGGTRTWHRLACAIEDAGFVLQDTLMWLYGSGFPKTKTQLKPAYEPIILAYKPGSARTLQVDECRVAFSSDADRVAAFPGGKTTSLGNGALAGPASAHSANRAPFNAERSSVGRWPANVCHDGSDEVVALFPQIRGAIRPRVTADDESRRDASQYRMKPTRGTIRDFGDGADSVARFFYCPKAGKEDRADSKHPTIKPVALTEWLVQLVTPPSGLVLDAFAGSGVTGQAATQTGRNAILIEQDAQSIVDIRHRLKMWTDACLIPARPRLQRPGSIPAACPISDRPRLQRPA